MTSSGKIDKVDILKKKNLKRVSRKRFLATYAVSVTERRRFSGISPPGIFDRGGERRRQGAISLFHYYFCWEGKNREDEAKRERENGKTSGEKFILSEIYRTWCGEEGQGTRFHFFNRRSRDLPVGTYILYSRVEITRSWRGINIYFEICIIWDT